MIPRLAHTRACFAVAVLSVLLSGVGVQAQSVMQFDPSVISAGMGGASGAVTWSAEPNYWANPALLGYYDGLRWQSGRTKLIPNTDVYFISKRFTLAAWGIGIESAGNPMEGMGGLREEFGTGMYGDPSGSNHENIESLALGISLASLTSSLLALRGAELPGIARHFDVALGYARKETKLMAGTWVLLSGVAYDRGLLLRGGFSGPASPRGTRTRFDVSYGHSVLEYDEGLGEYGSTRDGAALRLTIQQSAASAPTGSWLHRSLIRAIQPPAALGYAFDQEHVDRGYTGYPRYTVKHHGVELTMMNALSLRFGHVQNSLINLNAETFGLGVSLPVGDFAGARYDYARYARSSDRSQDLHEHSYSIFMNPLRMWREKQ